MKRIWIVLVVVILVAAAWAVWPRNGRELRASLVAEAAPADTAGFALVEPGIVPQFPRDHGPHDDYQTEWWYYTGNLESESGEHFGYQLTFFRRALTPPDQRVERTSDWATDQVYLAHFAITDVAGGTHTAFEKLARGAGGVAGAQAEPFRVWLEDWSVTSEAVPGSQTLEVSKSSKVVEDSSTPYRKAPERLVAAAGDIRLDLRLTDMKGPVLQGDRGYSQKGEEAANASIYYSLTRMAATGKVTVRGKTFTVSGLGWMDHEYSTSALGRDQVGWDWFSIQLDNNSELMVFQLRRADGSVDGFSSGTLVAADTAPEANAGQGAKPRRLGADDFSLRPTGSWRSPHTGGEYPSGWQLDIPSAGLSLTITPHLRDQEMNVSYAYWEGAVSVTGTMGTLPVSGNGYVELTGYAGSMQGQF